MEVEEEANESYPVALMRWSSDGLARPAEGVADGPAGRERQRARQMLLLSWVRRYVGDHTWALKDVSVAFEHL